MISKNFRHRRSNKLATELFHKVLQVSFEDNLKVVHFSTPLPQKKELNFLVYAVLGGTWFRHIPIVIGLPNLVHNLLASFSKGFAIII